VQRVGKQGGLGIDASDFCKFPDLQRPVLEKRTGGQVAFRTGLEQLFHFSCLNYGDYCLCFYIYFYFLLPVAQGSRGQSRSMLRWYQSEQERP
jgi:hypothetical protein